MLLYSEQRMPILVLNHEFLQKDKIVNVLVVFKKIVIIVPTLTVVFISVTSRIRVCSARPDRSRRLLDRRTLLYPHKARLQCCYSEQWEQQFLRTSCLLDSKVVTDLVVPQESTQRIDSESRVSSAFRGWMKLLLATASNNGCTGFSSPHARIF